MDLNRAFGEIMVLATGIVGLATLAVLISKNANTVNVIGASGNAFSNALTAATSPVTGGGYSGFASMNAGYGFTG